MAPKPDPNKDADTGRKDADDQDQLDGDEDDGDEEEDDFDKERALATIKKQRDSEKTLKKELRDLRKQVASIGKPADKDERTEVTALTEKIEGLTKSLRTKAVSAAAIEEATKLGFRNPTFARRLINESDVEFDDAGEPINIRDLLEDVLDEEPSLKGRRRSRSADGDESDDDDADAGKGRKRSARGATTMNDVLRGAIAQRVTAR